MPIDSLKAERDRKRKEVLRTMTRENADLYALDQQAYTKGYREGQERLCVQGLVAGAAWYWLFHVLVPIASSLNGTQTWGDLLAFLTLLATVWALLAVWERGWWLRIVAFLGPAVALFFLAHG
jgi:hypothetical protein